jgi:hypothetical protein
MVRRVMAEAAPELYLQFHIVIRPEEDRDRISLNPGPVYSPMESRFEYIVCTWSYARRRWRG